MEAIVEELAAYITDVDVAMARRSLQAMGKIGINFPESVEHIFKMLVLFLDLETSYITADTLTVMQDLLRKYPEMVSRILPRIPELARSDAFEEEADARCALLWILGEYGNVRAQMRTHTLRKGVSAEGLGTRRIRAWHLYFTPRFVPALRHVLYLNQYRFVC